MYFLNLIGFSIELFDKEIKHHLSLVFVNQLSTYLGNQIQWHLHLWVRACRKVATCCNRKLKEPAHMHSTIAHTHSHRGIHTPAGGSSENS